jgi:hypothetical protein
MQGATAGFVTAMAGPAIAQQGTSSDGIPAA